LANTLATFPLERRDKKHKALEAVVENEDLEEKTSDHEKGVKPSTVVETTTVIQEIS